MDHMLQKAPSVRNYENRVDETVRVSFLRFVENVKRDNQDKLECTSKPAQPSQHGCRCINFVATCASQISG